MSVSISIQQIGEECHDDGDDLNNVPNRDIETGGFSPSALRYAISGFSGLEPSHKAVTDTPKKLVLTVTDSGIGIPQVSKSFVLFKLFSNKEFYSAHVLYLKTEFFRKGFLLSSME